MPTRHPRIQVTEDPELSGALRAAAPHLEPGLSRAAQVRELAIAGARSLSEAPHTEGRREELLERLARNFEQPESAPWDWDRLRDGKRLAWPTE